VTIALVGSGLAGVSDLSTNVLYNPQVLSFIRGERGETGGEAFSVDASAAPGVVQVGVNFGRNATPPDNASFARLVMTGRQPGISYLVYQTPALHGSGGETIPPQMRASRVVVR